MRLKTIVTLSIIIISHCEEFVLVVIKSIENFLFGCRGKLDKTSVWLRGLRI